MKRTIMVGIIGFILMAGVSTMVLAQEGRVDRATVPFSDPSQPGIVKVQAFRGSITVTGYSGQEVKVEARVRGEVLQEKEASEKGEGMRLIRSNATGLTVTEEDNVMSIGSQSMKYAVDISVQVPFRTSLKLGAFNNGDITVENVTGEIEVNNHNGSIALTDISGNVVANTFNGGLTVAFSSITADKPMSFSTWNGDVDVTLPTTLQANVKMHSEQGDIYSDFDVQIKPLPQKQEAEKDEGGKFRIVFDKTVYGTVNGGGPEYSFKTFNGDIYIRKK